MPRPRGHKYAPGFPHNLVRAILLAAGKTLTSFADELQVAERTLRDVIDGHRPGRSGKTEQIRLKLQELTGIDATPPPATRRPRGFRSAPTATQPIAL